MNAPLIAQVGLKLGANGLPYQLPIHPKLVHLTIGLFIIAILFDIAATLFRFERPIFKFLGITALRSGFYDVGWYNLVAALGVTLFTVAAGFFEIMLAKAPPNELSSWGLTAETTMLLHGLGGILLFGAIGGMAIWRGFQRYLWRKDAPRQTQWSYLLVGMMMMGALYLHGTLGAHLADDFGIHNTAANLVRQGENPNTVLK